MRYEDRFVPELGKEIYFEYFQHNPVTLCLKSVMSYDSMLLCIE